MSDVLDPARLTPIERLIASVTGVALLGLALTIVVAPPERRVALGQCPNAAAGCVVTVDNDLTTFAVALTAIGAAAILVALLGVRFNRLTAAGAELAYEKETAGLPQAAPAADGEVDSSAAAAAVQGPKEDGPVKVDLREGLGKPLGTVPVAVTHLTTPMREIAPSILRDYQSARKESQHSHFLTHILGPAKHPGQKYSVAIRVSPHRDAKARVTSASFYLGRSWGGTIFEGRRGADGRFGIATEAYGPFLALCEVEFDDGSRILLDHYCDFDMGSLLPT